MEILTFAILFNPSSRLDKVVEAHVRLKLILGVELLEIGLDLGCPRKERRPFRVWFERVNV